VQIEGPSQEEQKRPGRRPAELSPAVAEGAEKGLRVAVRHPVSLFSSNEPDLLASCDFVGAVGIVPAQSTVAIRFARVHH